MVNCYVEGGQVVGTHGVRGLIRVKSWCDSQEVFCQFKKMYFKETNGFLTVNVISAKPHGNVVLLQLNDIDNIEKAEALRGQTIYLLRDDFRLDDGQYFVCDLINCDVYDADSGSLLGKISDVSKTGANDVWHISYNDKEFLIPVIEEVVKEVDLDENKVVIRPLKGIFEE